MKSILTKLSMGLLCASLAAAPATAAIERKVKPATESTTANTTVADAVATSASKYEASKITRAEKRDARKALTKALRDEESKKLIAAIIAIFVIGIGPALAMLIIDGDFTNRVLIALVLGLLFHIPGMIYALIQIFK